MNSSIDRLHAVMQELRLTFVGKEEIIDLMGLAMLSRENLFLLGPPGTAKSALVRELARLVNGSYFEYLLTRFTEPNEIFGPFDIRKLREGDLVTNTQGMLPEAHLIFLDELLNANSAILNSLLMVLNEKVFRRGKETRDLPALFIVGASNHLPEDEALKALFDRFLLRVKSDNVSTDQLAEVLNAGWKLEQKRDAPARLLSVEDLAQLQQQMATVDLEPVREAYILLIRKLRNAGVALSDRRAVKLQRLVAASALLCGRDQAQLSDLWVTRYIWDTEDQIEVIASIVNATVEQDEEKESQHPRANLNNRPDAEAMYAEVLRLTEQWDAQDSTPADKAVIKDRLRALNNRSEWIAEEARRQFVQAPIDALWKKILTAEA